MTGLENELEGITVISVEQAVAGPYCGMLLADAGARVIKVERPGGDFARIYDRWADGDSAIFYLAEQRQAIHLPGYEIGRRYGAIVADDRKGRCAAEQSGARGDGTLWADRRNFAAKEPRPYHLYAVWLWQGWQSRAQKSL